MLGLISFAHSLPSTTFMNHDPHNIHSATHTLPLLCFLSPKLKNKASDPATAKRAEHGREKGSVKRQLIREESVNREHSWRLQWQRFAPPLRSATLYKSGAKQQQQKKTNKKREGQVRVIRDAKAKTAAQPHHTTEQLFLPLFIFFFVHSESETSQWVLQCQDN